VTSGQPRLKKKRASKKKHLMTVEDMDDMPLSILYKSGKLGPRPQEHSAQTHEVLKPKKSANADHGFASSANFDNEPGIQNGNASMQVCKESAHNEYLSTENSVTSGQPRSKKKRASKKKYLKMEEESALHTSGQPGQRPQRNSASKQKCLKFEESASVDHKNVPTATLAKYGLRRRNVSQQECFQAEVDASTECDNVSPSNMAKPSEPRTRKRRAPEHNFVEVDARAEADAGPGPSKERVKRKTPRDLKERLRFDEEGAVKVLEEVACASEKIKSTLSPGRVVQRVQPCTVKVEMVEETVERLCFGRKKRRGRTGKRSGKSSNAEKETREDALSVKQRYRALFQQRKLKPGHECGKCAYIALRGVTLDVHVKLVHRRVAVRFCGHCDYATFSAGKLELHRFAEHAV
jgi:hypothetical protein